MKIKSEEDVRQLDLHIQNELGVDLKTYRKPEVAENFVELLVFPNYVIKWLMMPVLVSILLYVAIFPIVETTTLKLLLYSVFGLTGFLVVGLFSGLLILSIKMKRDMNSVLEYMMEILKQSVKDVKSINQRSSPENRKEVLGLLYLGIGHIIAIPMISQAIANKVPLVGGLLTGVVTKMVSFVSHKIKFADGAVIPDSNANAQEDGKVSLMYFASIAATTKAIDKVLNIGFRLVQIPVKTGLLISSLLLLIILYACLYL